MKIEIDLRDNLPLKGQMEAVEIYIRKHLVSLNAKGLVDHIDVYSKDIETTPKDTGERIETSYRNYHVSCHKTKGGTYKFKTWQAV